MSKNKPNCISIIDLKINHDHKKYQKQYIKNKVESWGREVSDAERQILALPLRHGGLGLTDPRETAKMEYEHSTQITNKLTAKIYTQKLDLDYNPSDQQFTRHTKKQNTTREK